MHLQLKFRIAIILLVFIPVIIMGTVSYSIYSRTIENKTDNFYTVSLQDTDRKLDYALNEISAVSDMAIIQPDLQQLLKQPPDRVESELAQKLNNLIMAHPKITSFQLYSNKRLIYSTTGHTDPSPLSDAPWYPRMLDLQGRPLWLGPGENGTYRTGSPVLIHARVVKEFYSLEDIGAIVITVKPDVLEQALWGTNTVAGSDILLLNRTGHVVFDKSGNNTGSVISASLASPFVGHSDIITGFDGEKSMLTTVPSAHENWVLAAVTPLKELQREPRTIRNIAVGLILFSLLTGFLFERKFIRPLINTIIISARGMKKVEQGHFIQLRSPTRWKDESKLLIDGFNQMIVQIHDLLREVETEQRRKKEAEMQALVAQINPHFIYNSLESINSMAVLAGNRDISRMVISLGKLLRISISENVESIPLKMELEHVKHYLNIQKMRFRDKFDYTIACPPSLEHLLTLRLIVQPLVENALYHGIETMEHSGFIRIEAFDLGQDLAIEVADTGLGFDLAQFERDRFSPAAGTKYKNSGVGLKNVYERIRMQYGPPYGLIVCSAEGCGTVIRIRIPKVEHAGRDQV
ncbi:sensor histidine kinase [Paenibacillus sp. MSJ-34]|uniref:cache domain-containing sensor histidine kinase n=1 Tax=Paenibacillus sp. MSJ-34 TaxID=2841529 RepID=UPI001C1028ED|nr:sensor histidine kinase [Paenibacillus sp. MSJ-34]MBU5443501.1 sensor histidine kinase [Paenibacillus sp. MSJ-34]